MVSHEHEPGEAHDKIRARLGIGSIADDIAEAANFLHGVRFNILKNRAECFEITMDIADVGDHRF